MILVYAYSLNKEGHRLIYEVELRCSTGGMNFE
jgi:hypothetical protein